MRRLARLAFDLALCTAACVGLFWLALAVWVMAGGIHH